MQIYLRREKLINIKHDSILPIAEEIRIISEKEESRFPGNIGRDIPAESQFGIRTYFAVGVAVGCDIKLQMIDSVGKASFQVIRRRRYGSGELQSFIPRLKVIRHTDTHIQVSRREEGGGQAFRISRIRIEKLGLKLEVERIEPLFKSLQTHFQIILQLILRNGISMH